MELEFVPDTTIVYIEVCRLGDVEICSKMDKQDMFATQPCTHICTQSTNSDFGSSVGGQCYSTDS